ncbi:hypothetical protein PAXRUDRAFT_825121 [Paxillus rubicundulus Ve08.2h10]|uniref:DUF6533 domain-containing protein n=1 Tax=Paxillus rubicundulus Ve08.2h10 TaxID=930991 RepID=A0A0D0EB91_9AGAM|nr:hypothetical protein PAXRUDRAFT_825121 [Paxillus rubicundulus Ve08.2h10]
MSAALGSVSYISSTINAHHASASILAISIFDLAINLDVEIEYLQNLRFGISKVFFVLCRILPLSLCSLRVAEDLTAPSKMVELCPIFVQAFNWNGAVILACAEYIFLLRTCALWADNKSVVYLLRTGFLVSFLGAFTFTGLASYLQPATYNIPDSHTHLTGCFSSKGKTNGSGVVPFVLMLALELETFCFTVLKFVRNYRSSFRGRMITSIVHHGVLYFTVALFLVVPVIITDLVGYDQGAVFGLIQIVGQAMAVTRMQVHLWAANLRPQTELPLPMTTIHFATEARAPEEI